MVPDCAARREAALVGLGGYSVDNQTSFDINVRKTCAALVDARGWGMAVQRAERVPRVGQSMLSKCGPALVSRISCHL